MSLNSIITPYQTLTLFNFQKYKTLKFYCVSDEKINKFIRTFSPPLRIVIHSIVVSINSQT